MIFWTSSMFIWKRVSPIFYFQLRSGDILILSEFFKMPHCFDTRWDSLLFQGEYQKSETHFLRQTSLKSKKSFGEILRIIRRDLELAKLNHLKLQTGAENLARDILQKQRYPPKSMDRVVQLNRTRAIVILPPRIISSHVGSLLKIWLWTWLASPLRLILVLKRGRGLGFKLAQFR